MQTSASHLGHRAALIVCCAAGVVLPSPARADLQICNRMSYVVQTALALEDKGAVATQGWFRINPGQCRPVLQGAIEAQRVMVHAETLPLYGAPPLPQTAHADLCVARGDFVIAASRACTRGDQRLAPFTEVKPSDGEKAQTVNLAEEADYDEEQARLAGIQRLLVIAGYDANPIDGIQGRKTDAAIAQFLKDRKLASDAISSAALFDILIEAAQQPAGVNFVWCNETTYSVMAALGVEDRGSITTRGWYRIEPGRCLRPDLRDKPGRIYSYAEAVDAAGHVAVLGRRRLTWGGDTLLCTRNVRFELAEHGDCPAMGLTATGFASIGIAGEGPTTVRFTVK